jgi:hypothetical protein
MNADYSWSNKLLEKLIKITQECWTSTTSKTATTQASTPMF